MERFRSGVFAKVNAAHIVQSIKGQDYFRHSPIKGSVCSLPEDLSIRVSSEKMHSKCSFKLEINRYIHKMILEVNRADLLNSQLSFRPDNQSIIIK